MRGNGQVRHKANWPGSVAQYLEANKREYRTLPNRKQWCKSYDHIDFDEEAVV